MAVWQSREESPQTDDDRDDDQRFQSQPES